MKGKEFMAIGLLIFGSLIVTYSCIMEPSGQLHTSILTFFGETITGALLLVGIKPPKTEKTTKKGQTLIGSF